MTSQRHLLATVLEEAADHPDVETGQIHEFKSQQLQRLIEEIANEMGFELTEYRLEIYGHKHGRTACSCYQIKVY